LRAGSRRPPSTSRSQAFDLTERYHCEHRGVARAGDRHSGNLLSLRVKAFEADAGRKPVHVSDEYLNSSLIDPGGTKLWSVDGQKGPWTPLRIFRI
jgi:hypothetical protein